MASLSGSRTQSSGRNLRKRKRTTDNEVFCPENHPQSHFISMSYFKGKKHLEYKVKDLKTVVFLSTIYNGKYLLAIGQSNSSKLLRISILKKPDVSTQRTLEEVANLEYNCFEFTECFVLNSGTAIVLFTGEFKGRNFDFVRVLTKFDLTENDNTFHITKKNQLQLPRKMFDEESSPEIFTIANGNFIVVAAGYEFSTSLVLVECSIRLSIQKEFAVDNIEGGPTCNIFLVDKCRKIGLGTLNSQYMRIDIPSQELMVLDLDSLDQFEYGHDGIMLLKFYLEHKDQDFDFALNASGVFYDITKETEVDIKTKLDVDDDMIVSDYKLCDFNKCVYLQVSPSNFVYVYNPFEEKVLCEYKRKYSNFSINWFGDQIFHFNVKNNKIIANKVFNTQCVSLKLLCRTVIFENYSKHQLLQMGYGTHINKLLFSAI